MLNGLSLKFLLTFIISRAYRVIAPIKWFAMKFSTNRDPLVHTWVKYGRPADYFTPARNVLKKLKQSPKKSARAAR